MLLKFRLWLEDQEIYDKKFKPRAEKAAARLGSHPFKNWFPEGAERTVVPLKTPALSAASHFLQSTDYLSPEDKQVVIGLKSLGYEVYDYRQGYVKRGQGVEKIGGLLEKLIKNAKDEEEKQKYRRWQNTFVNSSARKDKSMDGSDVMWVMISRNAHDIAQMSYDREWNSCMELEDGMYKNTPFCVIRTGGMVAYLLRKSKEEVETLANDTTKYIKDPIARISIKAAVNANDKSQMIAVPETRVYPHNIRGFYETVFDWIEQHQGNMGSGKYRVLGGYSDDYGDGKYRVHHRSARDADQLMQWLESPIEIRRKSAIKLVLDSRYEYPEAVYKKIKDLLMKSAWYGGETQENKQLLYMMKKFPEMFTNADKIRMNFFVKDKADLLGRHDRVAYDFGKQFGFHFAHNKLVKPEINDIKRLQHHLGEIAEGKAKFKDEEPFNQLVNYVINNNSDLQNLHFKTLAHYMAVDPHKDEMSKHVDTIAESLLDMLGRQNKLSDITEHHRYSLSNIIERLLKTVLASPRLTPSLAQKSGRIIEKLVEEGNTYFARYELTSIIQQQIVDLKEKHEVINELVKIKERLDKKLQPVIQP